MLREMGFMGILRVNPAIISVLLVFSILLVAFFLERFWTFLLYGNYNPAFWEKLKSCVKSGRLHEARGLCSHRKDVYSRVFDVVLNNVHMPRTDNEDLAQIEKELMLEQLRKRLGLFATLSFVSPLIGLLGTVTGIMQAFHDLGRSGSGGANIVAAGISEALVATAAGIMVAVPAALLYNYFTYRIRGIGVRLNNLSHELVIMVYGGENAATVQAAGGAHAKTIR
jgi:biopolymer transport protein ExbB